ncbi:MAG: hypothetical protein GY696_21300 [Gammaproteobacteria bacterium]|nr:hypothetical protein [Gammaproteobacteria bacterium]
MKRGQTLIYIPEHMAWLPLMEPGQGPGSGLATLFLLAGPIFACIVLYAATAIRLAVLSFQTKKKWATSSAPSSRQVEQEGAKQTYFASESKKRKAQWSILKIATILLILFVIKFLMGPISTPDYRIVYVNMAVEILITGINPLVYLLTSSTIKEATPFPCCPKNQQSNHDEANRKNQQFQERRNPVPRWAEARSAAKGGPHIKTLSKLSVPLRHVSLS